MESAVNLIMDALSLAAVFTVPGILLQLQLERPPRDAARLLVYGIATSIAYVLLVAVLLLVLGLFSFAMLAAAASIPIAIAAIRWRRTWSRLRQTQVQRSTIVPVLAVMIASVSLLIATPLWNFLVAPNMDAGNYELYGNHFWTVGSFYLDGSSLVADGAPIEWLESHNTWNMDPETGIARPSYLPAYPVLLGVFKAGFASAVASPAVNAAITGVAAMVMVLTGLRITNRPFLIASLTMAIVMTPMVIYYGKQMMSEQLGVLGVLLSVHAILEMRSYMDGSDDAQSPRLSALMLAIGLGIGLLARLDFYLLLPLLIVGFGLVVAESLVKRGKSLPASTFISPLFGIVVAAGIVAQLGADSYLRHGQPGFAEEILGPDLFILLFGVGNGLAVLVIGGIQVALTRADLKTHRTIRSRLNMLYGAAAMLWFLYILWNLYVRPYEPAGLGAPHDAENLLRLFTVTSPLLLSVVVLLVSLSLLARGQERGLILGLAVGLGIAILISRHSPIELWWMRRYIQYFVPLTLLVVAGSFEVVRELNKPAAQKVRSIVVAGLLMLTLAQGWSLRHMLTAEVNQDVPASLAQMMRAIPDDAFVVVIEGNPMVRGLANTYRSLEHDTVLVDVSLERLPDAVDLAPDSQPVAVVSPSQLDSQLLEDLSLGSDPTAGTIQRQWPDDSQDFLTDPKGEGGSKYLVYWRFGNERGVGVR